MVMSVSNLSRSGLRDWVIQRLSALLLLVYVATVVIFCLSHPLMTYQQWYAFFHCSWMQLATFMVAFAVFAHIWIGIWTVITDYIKPTLLRILLEMVVLVVVFGYMYWVLYLLFKI